MDFQIFMQLHLRKKVDVKRVFNFELSTAYQTMRTSLTVTLLIGVPAGIRTQILGSEDRCSIR